MGNGPPLSCIAAACSRTSQLEMGSIPAFAASGANCSRERTRSYGTTTAGFGIVRSQRSTISLEASSARPGGRGRTRLELDRFALIRRWVIGADRLSRTRRATPIASSALVLWTALCRAPTMLGTPQARASYWRQPAATALRQPRCCGPIVDRDRADEMARRLARAHVGASAIA